ncbi:hypothetical protein B0T14DRAFT_601166 [Immersiella caudata]|uniref:Ankyrin n=1 Tax=Immersiella caudata TaxID=314043 RepID=A0AA39WVY0_9PEZI|nr:hypothetical protein B0T14DRAFT_601166 [Immersiella caudata]
MATMHILHLPLEILDLVVYHSILLRTLPRALRLKLVCKSFRASFDRTFFHTHMLDYGKWYRHFRGPFRDSEMEPSNSYGAAALWHDYFVYLCRQKTFRGDPLFAKNISDIRSVANVLIQHRQAQEEEADQDDVFDRLCWLTVDCSQSGQEIWHGGVQARVHHQEPNLGLSTLSAATYFGYGALVQRLLDDGYDPTVNDYLFPAAMYIATRTGQTDMLLLLQENLPQFQHETPEFPSVGWRSKIGPESLDGACARGDLELARLCLYPPSRVIPEDGSPEEREMLIIGQKPGAIPPFSLLGGYIIRAMIVARSPEVYQYVDSLVAWRDEGPPAHRPPSYETVMAGAGNLAMVKYHLDKGDKPYNRPYLDVPLAKAVMAWSYDVVDLLLEHGADPNDYERRGRTLLTVAVRTGSMLMMRKLVDAGLKVRDSQVWPGLDADLRALRQAVKMEHRDMVELLLDMGAGTESGRVSVLRTAERLGLESMVDLLRSRGITLTAPAVAGVDSAKEVV